MPHAAAIKINVAFFEAFGSAGIAALERVRAAVPADMPFIADAKRGDIGTTAARQAVAIFDSLGADAVTANPYLGREAIAAAPGEAATASCTCCAGRPTRAPRSSRTCRVERRAALPGVARRVAGWASDQVHQVGLVVGATAPDELADDPRGGARSCRSWCRASARRAATWRRS